MGSVLYCKNIPVYDIDTEEVYNSLLLPGYMQKYPCNATFKNWLKLRYSSNTNTIARQLKGVLFGQGNRVTINKTTHALSLSDCYWIKDKEETLFFEDISPYFSYFWRGNGIYLNTSIPTLYVGGYLNKEWVDSETLCKYGEPTIIEYECYRICCACNIPVAEINLLKDGSGISVKNITTPDIMLEQADESGRIDPDDFNEEKIIKLFGLNGFQMILIDAIIGNGDRHAGNFGWLRNANTGQYISMSPLYDFDHALDEKETSYLMKDVIEIIKVNKDYYKEAQRVLNISLRVTKNSIIKHRILMFLDFINSIP